MAMWRSTSATTALYAAAFFLNACRVQVGANEGDKALYSIFTCTPLTQANFQEIDFSHVVQNTLKSEFEHLIAGCFEVLFHAWLDNEPHRWTNG